jgi:hypothetical protein
MRDSGIQHFENRLADFLGIPVEVMSRTGLYYHRNIPMILTECRRFPYLYGTVNAARFFLHCRAER